MYPTAVSPTNSTGFIISPKGQVDFLGKGTIDAYIQRRIADPVGSMTATPLAANDFAAMAMIYAPFATAANPYATHLHAALVPGCDREKVLRGPIAFVMLDPNRATRRHLTPKLLMLMIEIRDELEGLRKRKGDRLDEADILASLPEASDYFQRALPQEPLSPRSLCGVARRAA